MPLVIFCNPARGEGDKSVIGTAEWDYVPRVGDVVRLHRKPYEVVRVTWSALIAQENEGVTPTFISSPSVNIQLKELL